MNRPSVFFLLLLISLSSFLHARSSCDLSSSDAQLFLKAFNAVIGFNASEYLKRTDCSRPINEIRLSSFNLSGAISWTFLSNLTHLQWLDLSKNALEGSIPRPFWSSQSLVDVDLSSNSLGGTVGSESTSNIQSLNLSNNRFTNSVRLTGFTNLEVLDISKNDLKSFPSGLENLDRLHHLDLSSCNISGDLKPISKVVHSLKYLDVSDNLLSGSLPPLTGLDYLNVSFNNFTGNNVFGYDKKLFGSSKSHNSSPKKHGTAKARTHGYHKRRRKHVVALACGVLAAFVLLLAVAVLGVVVMCVRRRRRRKNSMNWTVTRKLAAAPSWRTAAERSGPFTFETDSGETWVADVKDARSAAVVMFEKPLMSLTFSDLMTATSEFGRESQLAEGTSAVEERRQRRHRGGEHRRSRGPVYRGVLPGDIHVAIKVVDAAAEAEEEEMAALEELAKLRHLNLLPLLGYCIAGKKKLLLYEYMEKGDLHRWLHEPLELEPHVDDWSLDTWENQNASTLDPPTHTARPERMGWSTRHGIALGTARGLAFLHHGGSRPVIHGHLVPSNVLLTEDFEARIADFGSEGSGTVESDVYEFGVILMELLTGRDGSEEMVGWVRGLVKEGKGLRALEQRLRGGDEWVNEMVEALRVGYLCTAESPDKRPTMKQVVGLLKDVRPHTASEVVVPPPS
ncbi:putative LRR receptor-like serine/threonine-protein kinase [Acorus calamus]|uniref:LRR receptor-like serine/threonine-protein kinase n=1 Tax=Acorus calamus TaxID=4465 RepID=A0AAV9FFG3_ACOCL|nr:putative LRR receptor-like serine/threonine-protein kinase [Acorus calamus]